MEEGRPHEGRNVAPKFYPILVTAPTGSSRLTSDVSLEIT